MPKSTPLKVQKRSLTENLGGLKSVEQIRDGYRSHKGTRRPPVLSLADKARLRVTRAHNASSRRVGALSVDGTPSNEAGSKSAHRAMFKKARREVRKLEKRIAHRIASGNQTAARRLQSHLLNSFYAKLIAFEIARKKTKGRFRPDTSQIIKMAKQLNVYLPESEVIQLKLEAKQNGIGTSKWRQIHSFRIKNKARQYLVRMALEPFLKHEIEEGQLYSKQSGGRDKAVSDLVDQILFNNMKWFSERDMAQFYSSIGVPNSAHRPDKTSLYEWLPLPEDVIKYSVLVGDSDVRCDMDYMPMIGMLSQTQISRKGVPQGSAVSPLIADTVMSRVLQSAQPEVPGGVSVFAYADNVGILGQTKRALEQAEKPLVHSAECCQFGFLRLNSKLRTRRVVDGFEFLGYFIRKRNRSLGALVEIEVSEFNRGKFYSEVRRRLKEICATSQGDRVHISAQTKQLGRYIENWCRGFQKVPNISFHAFGIAQDASQQLPPRITRYIRLAFEGSMGQKSIPKHARLRLRPR